MSFGLESTKILVVTSKRLEEKIKELLKTSERVSVDSELSLVKVGGYRLDGWIKNPYF